MTIPAVGGDARVVPLPAAPLPGGLPVRRRAQHGRARGRRAAAARPAGAAGRAPAASAGTPTRHTYCPLPAAPYLVAFGGRTCSYNLYR